MGEADLPEAKVCQSSLNNNNEDRTQPESLHAGGETDLPRLDVGATSIGYSHVDGPRALPFEFEGSVGDRKPAW